MLKLSRHCLAAVFIVLIAPLFLLPLTQKAGAGDGGPDGGVGARKAITIAIFKNSSLPSVRKLILQIPKNWDRDYKLLVPNSNSQINKALVRLARTHPGDASSLIVLISRTTSRIKVKDRIRLEIRDQKLRVTGYKDLAEAELEKGAKADIKKLRSYFREASRASTAVSRLEDILKALK